MSVPCSSVGCSGDAEFDVYTHANYGSGPTAGAYCVGCIPLFLNDNWNSHPAYRVIAFDHTNFWISHGLLAVGSTYVVDPVTVPGAHGPGVALPHKIHEVNA